MPTQSKGIREKRKYQSNQIINLKHAGESWKTIALKFGRDKNNVRRSYLRAINNATTPPQAIREKRF